MRDKRKKTRRIGPRRHTWLVDGWQTAHKWLSVQLIAVLGFMQVAYELIPLAEDYVPVKPFHWVMAALTFAVIFARLKAQKFGNEGKTHGS